MKMNCVSSQKEDDEVQQRAVPEAMGALDAALSRLESRVNSLQDRLSPVLSAECPTEGKASVRSIHAVPLAEELLNVTERIEALSARTVDVLDRLHV